MKDLELHDEPECFCAECEKAREAPALSDRAKVELAIEGFEKLARLGNGEQYGNSVGNDIALDYLKRLQWE